MKAPTLLLLLAAGSAAPAPAGSSASSPSAPATSARSTSPASAPSAPAEMRGLWVVRTALLSPEAVDRAVDQAHQAGFNALFVQVRGRGDAFYASRLVSRSVLLDRQPVSFDPLARLAERAHARGLEVHAWVNVLLTAHFGQPLPADHILARHPEWLMVPRSAARTALAAAPRALPWLVQRARSGDEEGFYLSPSAPGVAEHLEEVVREIVRGYPIEGLHLDFVRYPGPDYDYSRPALEGFNRRQGGGDLLGGPAASPGPWADYQREVLTAQVDRLARAARSERPWIVTSAAVVADEAMAVYHRFQEWPAWLAKRLLDAVCPMAYTPDRRIFRSQIEQARSRLETGQRLWAGIGAYRLSVTGIVERVREARASGASGVILFSHESLGPADLRRLHKEAFPAVAATADRGSGPSASNSR